MKLARKAMHNPDRKLELEEALDGKVTEVVAEANDAGYGTDEALDALDDVVDNQKLIYDEDPDPADDAELEQAAASRILRAS